MKLYYYASRINNDCIFAVNEETGTVKYVDIDRNDTTPEEAAEILKKAAEEKEFDSWSRYADEDDVVDDMDYFEAFKIVVEANEEDPDAYKLIAER